MTRVVVDAAASAQLEKAQQTLELYDPAGRLLGHFVPTMDAATLANAEPTISEEELTRRERQGGGRPLADILADLPLLAKRPAPLTCLDNSR